jgi:hypothetical protein
LAAVSVIVAMPPVLEEAKRLNETAPGSRRLVATPIVGGAPSPQMKCPSQEGQ